MTVLLLEQESDTADFVKMISEKGIKPNAIGVEVISDANLAKGLIEYAAKHTYRIQRKYWKKPGRKTLSKKEKENTHEI